MTSSVTPIVSALQTCESGYERPERSGPLITCLFGMKMRLIYVSIQYQRSHRIVRFLAQQLACMAIRRSFLANVSLAIVLVVCTLHCV